MGVMVAGSYDASCEGDELTNIIEMPPFIPAIGGPGDTAPTQRVASFTLNPLDACPDGDADMSGSLFAYAENYHNLSGQTASFSFTIHP